MIDRIIISALLSVTGYNGFFPDPPPTLTLKQKAQERSISAMCDRKQKSKTTKDLCKRWKERRNA
jgi:hypothetical protein